MSPTATFPIFKRKQNNLFCNGTFDGWGCWNRTEAGTRVYIQCPNYIPGFNTSAFAFKDCLDNGTWYINENGKEYADYTSCFSNIKDEIAKAEENAFIYVAIGGFSMSLLCLVISLFIFFYFRQLRCERITLHKNLFISYLFTGLFWIMYYSLASLNGAVLLDNPLWCRILHVLTQYLTCCNFAWMFAEGLYLHVIMVRAFSSGKSLLICCYVIGWAVPAVLTAVYTGVRAYSSGDLTHHCWLLESDLQWIIYGPIVLSLIINVIFLINIVSILVTKLRQIPEPSQTKKAVRATLILIPMLGLQYLLFPIKPEKGSAFDGFYHYFSALVISLQGAFVSIMYCFCNTEVINVLKRKWEQRQLMLGRKSTIVGSTTVWSEAPTITNHEKTSVNQKLQNNISAEDAMEMKKLLK